MTNAEFETIFEAHKDAVYGFAWRMTGSATVAEDIAQDCFTSLWKTSDRFNPVRGSARAWLLGIARHLILKRWRAESRWTVLDDDSSVPSPEPPPADWTTVRKVAYAVQSLPPLQREVIVLIEYEGMSLQEAALTTDSEIGTIKARLHRARESLRRMLQPLRSSS